MMSRTQIGTLIALIAVGVIGALPVLAQNQDPYAPVIDPANFIEGVDNPYFPLPSGTTFIYESRTRYRTEHIEVTVTDDTKEILGVECVVVRDTVQVNGKLVEDTYEWYAQDVDGNVWYMGEATQEHRNGKVISAAGSWEAGKDGAKPGIIVWADPQVGQAYRQEYYVRKAEDMAEVISPAESASVAYGDFDDLLVTKEWSPLEPSVIEHKYYAAGVGLVLEELVKGGSGRTELIDIVTPIPNNDTSIGTGND
jgi:hypothetical protein